MDKQEIYAWIHLQRTLLDNQEDNKWTLAEVGSAYFMGANNVLEKLEKFLKNVAP